MCSEFKVSKKGSVQHCGECKSTEHNARTCEIKKNRLAQEALLQTDVEIPVEEAPPVESQSQPAAFEVPVEVAQVPPQAPAKPDKRSRKSKKSKA